MSSNVFPSGLQTHIKAEEADSGRKFLKLPDSSKDKAVFANTSNSRISPEPSTSLTQNSNSPPNLKLQINQKRTSPQFSNMGSDGTSNEGRDELMQAQLYHNLPDS